MCCNGLRGGFRGGLETFELVEGVFVGALRGVHAALQADEGGGGAGEGLAEGRVFVGAEGGFHFVLPKLGIGFGETAELPVVTNEGVEVMALFGGGGVEALVVFGG